MQPLSVEVMAQPAAHVILHDARGRTALLQVDRAPSSDTSFERRYLRRWSIARGAKPIHGHPRFTGAKRTQQAQVRPLCERCSTKTRNIAPPHVSAPPKSRAPVPHRQTTERCRLVHQKEQIVCAGRGSGRGERSPLPESRSKIQRVHTTRFQSCGACRCLHRGTSASWVSTAVRRIAKQWQRGTQQHHAANQQCHTIRHGALIVDLRRWCYITLGQPARNNTPLAPPC
jgi:hypothetical protein